MAIFTGTHGLANGLHAVIDTAFELKKRGRHDIKLALVGSGRQKSELQQRAKELGLNNVIFHDRVNKADLAGLMASANIGLQILSNVPAFYYGTSPNKFFDYISAGLPVLNNYPGWLAELIAKENCGFTVRPNDPVHFADTLEYASANLEELRQMGDNALLLAKKEFDRSHLAKKFNDWITGAVND